MSDLSSVPVETQTGDDIPLVTKQQYVSSDLEEGKVSTKNAGLNEKSFSSQEDKPLGLPTPVTMAVDSMLPKVGSDSPHHTPTISLGGAKMELKVTYLIPIWIILSSSLIIYNNYIFHTLHFKFPVFLFMWHLIFTAIGTRILARTTHLLDALKTTDVEPVIGINIILPIATLFLMSSLTSNLTYAHLSGGYIQKLKAFNPVTTLFFYRLVRKTSRRVFAVVLAIGFGVCMANYDNTPGADLVLQGLNVLVESSRLVLIEYLLHVLKMDALVALYYIVPVTIPLILIILPIAEGLDPFKMAIPLVGFGHLFANALTAFTLNITSLWLIGTSSALVLTLTGVFKDLLMIAGCMIAFGNEFSVTQTIGYLIAITGLIAFRVIGSKV